MATELTETRARQLRATLTTVCATAGLDPDGATLLRYTNNAVWSLPKHPIVVRIAYGPLGIARAPRVVTMARWLTDRRAPIPQLVPGIDQPFILGDTAAATLWQRLPGAATRWTAQDLAHPLRQFHALTPDDTELPRWNPFTAARRRLHAADPVLPADDVAWLTEQWEEIEHDYRTLDLPMGILHGDAHTGNLLRDNDRTVLCDLDSTGIGPTAWDLVVTAVDDQRFGRDTYPELAAAYGRDVTTEPAWPTLRRIRELSLVTSVIADLARRPAVAAEHRRRLDDLRHNRPYRWTPYR